MTWHLNIVDRVQRLQEPLVAGWARLIDHLNKNANSLIAVATVALAIFAYMAWSEAQRTARIAQHTLSATHASLVAAQRAGVYFQDLQFIPVQEDGRPLMWHVGPVWQNAGSTPTKALTFELICPRVAGRIDRERVDPYELRGAFAPLFMSGLIGPRQSQLGGVCEISPEEMDKIKEGNLALFVVAVARYQNTLDDKSAHETWQCLRVANLAGNFSSTEGPAPSYSALPCGGRPNCADEDCKGRKK